MNARVSTVGCPRSGTTRWEVEMARKRVTEARRAQKLGLA
jgi:hypothetical protein